MTKRKPYFSAFAKPKFTWLMAKGRRRSYPLQFSKLKRRKTMALEDEISTLPDDILLYILSLLTFKEAVATSILSRRWRYLWTSLPSLNFRYEEVLQHNNKDTGMQWVYKLLGVYKDQYIQTVNQVLRLYKGLKLHDFAIHYPFEESSSCHIDLWVAFAIAIGVSRLELNISRYSFPISGFILKNYCIPLDLFDKMKGMEPYLRQLDDVFSMRTSSFNVQNRFKSLRELILKFVDLTDELFETILSSCTSLEHLYLLRSHRLVNAKHTVPHLKLKCLEIYRCYALESTEIFAPNLVSFKYRGPKINICVKDAKQLVNLCVRSDWSAYEYPGTNSLGCTYPRGKDFVFGQFAAYLSQLEYLAMDISSFEGKQAFSKIPLLSNLKHLSLTGSNHSNGPYSVVRCYQMAACFIKASPFLRRLELHFTDLPGQNGALRRIPMSPHKHLKEVLVSGFQGNTLVMEFIMSIFDCAIALEKYEITTAYLGGLRKCYYRLDKDEVAARA